jgi:hypothetical protein
VCRPQLGGSLRGVERVREQEKLIDETGLRRCQNGCLPTSVRMATQKQAARSLSSHGSNCRSESLLVTFRAATLWRPVRSQLAEGKIATEDGQPGGAERTRQRHEERGIAVRSRAVRQDEAIPIRIGRAMQKPSNGYFALRSVQKFSMRVHTHGPSYSMAATISPTSKDAQFLKSMQSPTSASWPLECRSAMPRNWQSLWCTVAGLLGRAQGVCALFIEFVLQFEAHVVGFDGSDDFAH